MRLRFYSMRIASVTIVAFLFATVLVPQTVAQPSPLTDWKWRNPLPQANNLSGIKYSDGRWLAVGAFGAIISSLNAKDWSPVLSPTRADLYSIDYGANQWVVVGNGSTILVSNDGTNWRMITLATTPVWLTSVGFGDGKWVAVGGNGTILFSSDGTKWATVNSPTRSTLYKVLYAGGRWLAASDSGMISSVDGITWKTVSCP